MDHLHISKKKMEGDQLPVFAVIFVGIDTLPKYSGTGALLQKNPNWRYLKFF